METLLENETLGGIGRQALTIWEQGFMGVDIRRLLIGAAVLLAALVLRRPVAALLLRALGRRFSPAALKIAQPPAQVLSLVIGLLIVTDAVAGNARVKAIGHDAARSLIVFALFWAVYRAIPALFRRLDERSSVFSDSMMGVAVAGGKIVVATLGAATVLELWGVRIGPVLAGFGLVGAAVALGAQDLFRNLIGGVFIIAERRFGNGDWIAADGVCEGTVEKIGLRTTRIRGFDLSPVYVPNAQLSDNPVTNYQQMTFRRISWTIGLTYDTMIPQLRKVRDDIEAHLKGDPAFVQPPEAPLFVRVDGFGDSAINLMLYCFTRTTDWGEWLKIKEDLACAISDIVTAAGSGFAFPSQSIYVETLPKGAAIIPAPAG